MLDVCMAYSSLGNQWQFADKGGESVSVRISGPVNANNGMFLAEMAVAGSGIVYGPCFILQPLIESGKLVRLLAQWDAQRLPIHAVYPTRRHLSAKVQAMTAFLGEWFARQPDKTF